MANHQATKKDIRQSAKRRLHNRYYAKTTRNAIKKIGLESDLNKKIQAFPDVVSMVDKLAKRGILHRNKAARIKSRLAKSMAKAV